MADLLIFLVIGLLFLGIGIYLFIDGIKKKRICTAFTDGIVRDFERTYKPAGGGYHMKYSYIVNDIEYFHTNKISGGRLIFNEGDKIKVYYNPTKPEQCYSRAGMIVKSYIISIFFIILGSVCIIVPLF
jgi:hypothetical protein